MHIFKVPEVRHNPSRWREPNATYFEPTALAAGVVGTTFSRETSDASRIRAHHPNYPHATDATIAVASFTLRDAQLVVATEYFFENWADLKEYKTGGATPNAVKDFELAE